MDFGIALAVSARAGGSMTETGLSLGAPHHMSPAHATDLLAAGFRWTTVVGGGCRRSADSDVQVRVTRRVAKAESIGARADDQCLIARADVVSTSRRAAGSLVAVPGRVE